jgi:preprotein translocase subunit SecE
MAGGDNKKKQEEGGLAGVIGWAPRKLAELKAFLTDVKLELKKVTWPSRPEVYNTTIVVLITTFFFGFYLWGLDHAFFILLKPILALR